MRNPTRLAVLVAAIAIAFSVSAASAGAAAAKGAGPEKAPEAPEFDWIPLENGTWLPVVDPLGVALHTARDKLKSDPQAAAAKLREGAQFLEHQAEYVTDPARGRMTRAAADLDKLAGEVAAGKVTSPKQLDPVFARAHSADIDSRWASAPEASWLPVSAEPMRQLTLARKNYLQAAWADAASDIHKAAALLKLEATRATTEGRGALMTSAKDLDQLGDRVHSGAVKTLDRLDSSFARADYALARHHYLKASEFWAKNDTKQAGAALQAAAAALEHGMARAGRGGDEAATAAIKDAREVGVKLANGGEVAAAEVRKAMAKINGQIEALRRAAQAQGRPIPGTPAKKM